MIITSPVLPSSLSVVDLSVFFGGVIVFDQAAKLAAMQKKIDALNAKRKATSST